MALAELYADGIEAGIQRDLRRPAPPPDQSFSTWGMIGSGFSAIPGAALEAAGSFADLVAGMEGRSSAALAGMGVPITDADRKADVQRRMDGAGRAMRQKADDFFPDPLSAHWSETAFSGLARFATKAVADVALFGPTGGAATLGLDEFNTTRQRLIDKGVDSDTATKAGAVTGVVSALGVRLPMAGKTVAGTTALVAVGGPGSFVAHEALTREILQRADYPAEAMTHDPTDPLGLVLSTVVPGAFGAYAMRGARVRQREVAGGGVPLAQMTGAERTALKYNDARLDDFARQAAETYGVPPEILLGIKNAGEKSNSTQTSPAGARGVMQFMPATAREMGLTDPTDPLASIDAGARYLRKLHNAYGSWDAAVAHYNGGGAQAAIVRGGGKPTIPETAAYLERVQKYARGNAVETAAARPEMVDAARVQVLEQTVARSLPDHPEALADVIRASDEVAAGRTPLVEQPARLDVAQLEAEAAQHRNDFAAAGTQDSADFGGNPDHHVGAFLDARPDLAVRDAHGIAGGNALRRLDELLADGVDPQRPFHTVKVGDRGGMLADRVNDSASFVVLGREDGAPIREGGIQAVVVNGGHAFAVPRIAEAHPGVEFIDATTGRSLQAMPRPQAGADAAEPPRPASQGVNALPVADSVAIERAPAATSEPGSLDAQVTQRLLDEQPGLQVKLPGSDETLSLKAAMERIKEEKADEAGFADLVRVAVQCALST